MERRRRMSAKEKMIILRELFPKGLIPIDNKVQIGELSGKYKVHPNVIYICPIGMPLAEKNFVRKKRIIICR